MLVKFGQGSKEVFFYRKPTASSYSIVASIFIMDVGDHACKRGRSETDCRTVSAVAKHREH
jgi:hypothetical protein